jgi:hypothetical protein
VFLLLAVTSILEGVFPRGSEASPRDQLLRLGDQPILPTFPDPTKRMKLSHEALNTMPDERVRLAIQLYCVIHELRDGDFPLFKTTRNQLQHPRPSAYLALLSLSLLEGEVPFEFDPDHIANILIEQEAMKDTGDPQSSLFGQTHDPAMVELLKHL